LTVVTDSLLLNFSEVLDEKRYFIAESSGAYK